MLTETPRGQVQGERSDRADVGPALSGSRGCRPLALGRGLGRASSREGRHQAPLTMQITIEDLSPVEKKVEFELPWADVAPKLDKAYDSLRRDVRLPGFRPGKVPRALLERMYRRQVEDEVARELVERSLGQAIQENQIQPVAPPTVDELEIKSGAPFKFSARVEVRSQVTPKDYSGIAAHRAGRAKVTDEQVAEALEGYRRRLTEFKPVEGRTRDRRRPTSVLVEVSRQGRRAQDQEARSCWSIWRTTPAGRCPAWPAGCAASRSAASAIEVKYTLPAEGVAPPSWPGSDVHLHVTHQGGAREAGPGARRRAGQGHRRGRDARGAARPRSASGWSRRTSSASSARWSGRWSRSWSSATTFPIAPALVDRYAQAIVNRAKSQLMMMGIDVEAVDDGARCATRCTTEAEEEARGAILVQAIAEREGITASDADVQKRIAELAAARNENPKQLRAELEKDHRIHQIETQIREQKTLDMLISQAKITDGDPAPSLIVTPEQARQERQPPPERQKPRPKSQKGTDPMSQFDDAAARHQQLHHPDGHRADPPGRARLGHLLAPAQGPDHLPRHGGRRSGRQHHHRPAPVPRERGPGQGHHALHQLAGRDGDGGHGDLRHHAVRAPRRGDLLHGPGGLDGRVPAGRRAPRASATRCRTRAS